MVVHVCGEEHPSHGEQPGWSPKARSGSLGSSRSRVGRGQAEEEGFEGVWGLRLAMKVSWRDLRVCLVPRDIRTGSVIVVRYVHRQHIAGPLKTQ